MNKKLLLLLIIITLIFLPSNTGKAQKLQKKPILIQKKADLTVSFVRKRTIQRIAFQRFKTMNFEVLVKNIGEKKAQNFYVDFLLSQDTRISLNRLSSTNIFQEDHFIRDARKHIASLAPGASIKLPAPHPLNIEKLPKAKEMYLGVVVDSLNSVVEKSEINNKDWYKIPFFFPISINSYGQLGYMSSGSNGKMNLILSGSGFGSSPGSKQVHLGPHILPILQYDWTPTSIIVETPNSVSFAIEYDAYVTENSIRISNKKKVTLKMYIESVVRQVGNNYEHSGPAGSALEIHGANFGAAQGSFVVRFGTATPVITSWNHSKIELICPSLPPGSYQVYIEMGGQDITFQKGSFQITPN